MELKIKSWKDCTISTYFDIQDIVKDENMQPYEKEVALISLLCGEEDTKIWDLSVEEFTKLQGATKWIGEIELRNVEKLKFKKIVIDGEKFTVDGDFTKFSVAQYIDFQTFWGKRNDENWRDIIGNVLVCFIIPQGKKYANEYNTQELAEFIVNHLDIETAYEIISFFFVSWLRSMKNSLHSSAHALKKMSKKMSKEQWSETIAKTAEMEQALIDGFTLLTQSVSL